MFGIISFVAVIVVFVLYIRHSRAESDDLKSQIKTLSEHLEKMVDDEDKLLYQLIGSNQNANSIPSKGNIDVH